MHKKKHRPDSWGRVRLRCGVQTHLVLSTSAFSLRIASCTASYSSARSRRPLKHRFASITMFCSRAPGELVFLCQQCATGQGLARNPFGRWRHESSSSKVAHINTHLCLKHLLQEFAGFFEFACLDAGICYVAHLFELFQTPPDGALRGCIVLASWFSHGFAAGRVVSPSMRIGRINRRAGRRSLFRSRHLPLLTIPSYVAVFRSLPVR